MAHAHRLEGREIGSEPLISYVTASLQIDYIKPTPLNGQGLELRAQIKKVDGRKTYIKCSIFVNNIETAQGEVLGIRISEAPIKL
jgi:acyl-CoA thioesterase FadM